MSEDPAPYGVPGQTNAQKNVVKYRLACDAKIFQFCVLWTILIIVSCGILFPLFIAILMKYLLNHTQIIEKPSTKH